MYGRHVRRYALGRTLKPFFVDQLTHVDYMAALFKAHVLFNIPGTPPAASFYPRYSPLYPELATSPSAYLLFERLGFEVGGCIRTHSM